MSYVTRYYPFSPGVPWKLYKGKYIVPQLTNAVWAKTIEPRDPIVVSNGGLLEAYYSLFFLELLNFSFHGKKFYWSGMSKFEQLIRFNGLADVVAPPGVSDSILSRFPTPIFMDTVGNVYLNSLASYTVLSSIYGGRQRRNYRPLVQQIIQNSTQPWQEFLAPKMRNWGNIPSEIEQWAKVNRFDFNKPYIVIAPDRGLSIHKQSFLGWGEMELRNLASMLAPSGIQTIVFSDKIRKTHTSPAWFLKVNPSWMLYFSQKAKAILSEEIDLLMVGLLLSPKSKIIGKKHKSPWTLSSNAKFFGRKADIWEPRELIPFKVYQKLTDQNGR